MRCSYPVPLKAPSGRMMYVPCNTCQACRIARVEMWTTRMLHEAQMWNKKCWVTLTYNEHSLPMKYDVPTLYPPHIRRYFKKIRKKLARARYGKRKIKYYMCGEYGGKFGRPHYHAVVYGMSHDEKLAEIFRRYWIHGFVKVAPVGEAQMRYVAKYTVKKLLNTLKERPPGQLEEFASGSQGMGLEYARKYMDTWMRNGHIMRSGKRRSIPRYYRKKLLDENQKLLYTVSMKERREKLINALMLEYPHKSRREIILSLTEQNEQQEKNLLWRS